MAPKSGLYASCSFHLAAQFFLADRICSSRIPQSLYALDFRSISTYRPYINHSFSSRPKMAPTLNIEGKRILLEQGLKQGFPSFKKILVIIIIHSFIQFVLACATIFHQHSSFKFDVPFRNENRPGRHLCLVRKSLRERTDRKDSYET